MSQSQHPRRKADHSPAARNGNPDRSIDPTKRSSHSNAKFPFKLQDWSIDQLPGLTLQDQTQLVDSGIKTTQHLLKVTHTPTQRQALATQLQTRIQRINKWSALANLAQIPAVGCQYCGLLLHAGIVSPTQLAQTPLPKLHQQILKLHVATMQRPDLCPGLAQISEWIEQAKQMSRKH